MRSGLFAVLAFAIATCACGGGSSPTTASTSDPNELLQGVCGYAVRRGDTALVAPTGGGPLTILVRTAVGGGVACAWSVVLSEDARSFVALVDPSDGQSSATNAVVTINVTANTVGSVRVMWSSPG